jgi:phage terminase Nu1 subunit (DNA packaging protein)
VTRWLRTEGPWKPYAKSQSPNPADDPLLADGDSPGLERYRLAKAKHAELDLEQRKGELIEREKAKLILSRWASLIRQMGERLSKRYGNEAAKTVNETLDECGVAVEEVMSDGA